MEERHFSLSVNCKDRIWSILKYLKFTTFSGLVFSSGEELLKWLDKKVKFGQRFEKGGYVLGGGFHIMLIINKLWKYPIRTRKGKIVLQHQKQYQGSLEPWSYLYATWLSLFHFKYTQEWHILHWIFIINAFTADFTWEDCISLIFSGFYNI